jgi:iron(III) transport system substrate-binding protein
MSTYLSRPDLGHGPGAAAVFLACGILAACTAGPSPVAPDQQAVGQAATASEAAGPATAVEEPAATGGEVVIYTSVDQVFSEPVLDAFAEQTGIEVQPVFDVEAAKTTGLANRLRAEADRPQADVWWNGEFAQTVALAGDGVFQPYASPGASAVPPQYKDADGLWTGFGGRARVLLVNTDLIPPGTPQPDSIYDLVDPPVPPEQAGMALPMFGTAATHAAALHAQLGPEAAREYYEQIEASGIQLVDGNSVVRDMVADGRLAFGITDTDDACGAVERGAPVAMVFPDQAEGELGTLIIPNTVAMVAGAPNPDNAKKLIDYLLGQETITDLTERGWFQVPVEAGSPAVGPCVDATDVKGMEVSLEDVAQEIEPVIGELTDLFVR